MQSKVLVGTFTSIRASYFEGEIIALVTKKAT